ncbi:MAG: nicotinate-nucleotide adenylyltransferase [Clostridium sp.]|nr:nicotinate-nucleotide adenylyltransferase [Clostridium sp.]
MLKIGIMGGTFDPVHIGHLIIAEKAREQFELDEVIFMPSGIPYMKDTGQVLPGNVRAEMTELAIEGNPFFSISTIEVDKEGHTYTYETIETLQHKNPHAQYYFIMGADSLFSIEHWKNPEKIFAGCHILAALRDDKTMDAMEEQAAYLKNKFAADICLIKTGQIEVSSSMIRDLIRDGHSIRYLVPDAVYDYIIKNKLYKAEK